MGGQIFSIPRSTLDKVPESMLSKMVTGKHQAVKDKDGRYFINADGNIFRYILEYIRHGSLPPLEFATQVYDCASDWNLGELKEEMSTYAPIMQSKRMDKVRSMYPDSYTSILSKIMKNTRLGKKDCPSLLLLYFIAKKTRKMTFVNLATPIMQSLWKMLINMT